VLPPLGGGGNRKITFWAGARGAPGHVGVFGVGEDELTAVQIVAEGGELVGEAWFHPTIVADRIDRP
jgi:hypothetical protein